MDDNKNSRYLISLKDKKVCVMGLGFVGLTLAVTLADIGYEVLWGRVKRECSKAT